MAAPDRQLIYDFSTDTNASGLASLLRPDGEPYGWSFPLYRNFSCMCEGRRDDGAHLYGWNDENNGTTDGRIDEFEVGETDNGVAIEAQWETGWIKDDPDTLTVHEAQLEHVTPSGATVSLTLHRSYQDDTYSVTPSATGALGVTRENKQFSLAARTPTAAFYLSGAQTAGDAQRWNGIDVLVERVKVRGRGPSYG